jgi:hypothetical protein
MRQDQIPNSICPDSRLRKWVATLQPIGEALGQQSPGGGDRQAAHQRWLLRRSLSLVGFGSLPTRLERLCVNVLRLLRSANAVGRPRSFWCA